MVGLPFNDGLPDRVRFDKSWQIQEFSVRRIQYFERLPASISLFPLNDVGVEWPAAQNPCNVGWKCHQEAGDPAGVDPTGASQ